MSHELEEPGPRDPRYAFPPIIVDAANAPPLPEPYRPTRLTWTPVLLFAATCYTTTLVAGLAYSIPLLVTLLCHEFGHFLQARRWQVLASWPYFIPMTPPLGTMGAVISMRGHMGNRRALFDIGISGPLAGLVPALIFSIVGLKLSTVAPVLAIEGVNNLGTPLLFQWLGDLILGPVPPGHDIYLHPVAYAGWVGIFITALNLIPIGQLDGGHVLYALLRRKAHIVAQFLLIAALVAMMVYNNWNWLLMLLLLLFMGPKHPPTANDSMPLGTGRTILGWLTLCFIFIGFTPHPFR